MGPEWARSSVGEHPLHTRGVVGSIPTVPTILGAPGDGAVAQLVRALPCHGRSRGFESHQRRQIRRAPVRNRRGFILSSHARLLGHLLGMKHRSDRIIVWALALSLAVHAIFLAAVRFTRPVQADEKPTRVVMRTIVHVPPPTPPPTPPPHVKPSAPTHPTTATRPRINAPTLTRTDGHVGKDPVGPVIAGPVVEASTGPIATDSPKPACSVPNAPATTISVISPATPDDAAGEVGTAQIRVTLTAAGAVSSADVYHSAGNVLLDRAALVAARQTTYRAAVRDCISVGGSYLFTATFTQ